MRIERLLGCAALAAAIAAPALGQKATTTFQKVAAAEKVSVANLTLEQALAKPDATVLKGKDGKDLTVAQLRRAHQNRQKTLAALKVPKSFLVAGSTGKTRAPGGLSRAGAGAQLLAADVAAAQSLHSARLGPGGPNRAKFQRPQPGIYEVNGKMKNFVLSPGKPLSIGGFGLGTSMGQANAIGQFPSGAVSLRIVDWHDDQVDALFPPDVRGVPDQPITVQVVTPAGKIFKLDGGKFYATREDVTLTHGIPRVVRLAAGGRSASMSDDGTVYRTDYGESINCFPPSADTLTAVDPGKGFVVTGLGATWGRTDSGDGDYNGDAGSRTFFPGYGFGEWSGDSIRVNWGVWRSHTSPYGMLSGWDSCVSSYQIAVSLSGPAGVSPF